MSSGRKGIPTYRLHRPSGRAVVTLSGRDFYLGPYRTQVSRDEYDRVVAEWLANGRRLRAPEDERARLTVAELLAEYVLHCETYYQRDGKPTAEFFNIRTTLRVIRRLYGRAYADEFGPLALKACREELVGIGQARGTINQNVSRMKRMFRWATENELLPATAFTQLQAVAGLRRGRTLARETTPVRPVEDEHIEAVLAFVSSAVAAMIRVQLVTGARPGEIVRMRLCEIDRSEHPWVYVPAHHKTAHLGHERRIFLGRHAQDVLRPFLDRDPEAALFSPQETEEARNAQRRLGRKSPMTPSQARRARNAKRKRPWRKVYTVNSYRRAVTRACKKAGIPTWTPHQLRHNAATRIRRDHGIEAARVIQGHRSTDVTEIYAEKDWKQAREIMARVG
ncbi:MAG: site-specific integrase [Planctomycetota bacterium]|nr:site-specific integrase [Planctomycetota bacterium]